MRVLAARCAAGTGPGRPRRGDADRSGLRDAYRAACLTLGRHVRVPLPARRDLRGTAADVDAGCRCWCATADGGTVAVAAGDVVHLR